MCPCCPGLLLRARGQGLAPPEGCRVTGRGDRVCAGLCPAPCQVPSIPSIAGPLPCLPAITVKWRIPIKKETLPKTPARGGGRAPPCAPSLLLPALPGGHGTRVGAQAHGGHTGDTAEPHRESSPGRAGPGWLAWLPWCSVPGLAAILQLWLQEGAGRGCAGVRGCAQAGGIISSYYSTSQSKCFLKASIH